MASASVLVIENDTSYVEGLTEIFSANGIKVNVAHEGHTGMQMLSQSKPDLIVLAIELPTVSGYSVCKKLKRHPDYKGIPLFLISKTATKETFAQHRKLKNRAEEYFIKPFEISDLWELAQEHLAPVLDGGAIVEQDGDTSRPPSHGDENGASSANNDGFTSSTAFLMGAASDGDPIGDPSDPPSVSVVRNQLEVSILKKQLERRESDYQSLREEHSKLMDELGDLREAASVTQKQISDLKQHISRQDFEVDEHKRRVSDLEITEEQLRTTLAGARNQIELLQLELEEINEEHDLAETHQQSRIQNLSQTTDELESQIESQKARIEELEATQQSKGDLIDRLEVQIQDIENRAAQMSQELESAQSRNEAKDAELETLRQTLQERSDERESIVVELEEANTKLASLNQDHGELESWLEEATSAKDAAQKENEALTEKLQAIKAELEDFQGHFDAQREELESITQALETSQNEHETLQGEHTSLKEIHEAVEAEHKALKEELASLQEEHNVVQEDLLSVQEAHTNLQEEHANTSEEFTSVQQELSVAREQIEAQQAEIESLQGEINEQSSNQGLELERVNGLLDEATQRNTDTSAQLKETQQTLSSVQEELAALKKELAQTQDELEQTRQSSDRRIKEVVSSLEELGDAHDLTKNNLKAVSAYADDLERRLLRTSGTFTQLADLLFTCQETVNGTLSSYNSIPDRPVIERPVSLDAPSPSSASGSFDDPSKPITKVKIGAIPPEATGPHMLELDLESHAADQEHYTNDSDNNLSEHYSSGDSALIANELMAELTGSTEDLLGGLGDLDDAPKAPAPQATSAEIPADRLEEGLDRTRAMPAMERPTLQPDPRNDSHTEFFSMDDLEDIEDFDVVDMDEEPIISADEDFLVGDLDGDIVVDEIVVIDDPDVPQKPKEQS